MTVDLMVTETPDDEGRAAIEEGLVRFNARHIGMRDTRHLSVLIRDGATGRPTGGLWGKTSRGWLVIELLFVPEDRRGAGLGASLVRAAEDAAEKRGCHGARVETYDFQARGFYEKLGYHVFGVLDDCPTGHAFYALQRRLEPRRA
ncbi:GNAT family N-acetyltransferase [Marinivivus vitaminiproducens]|uniref:GNAT family N-acetyltransferase n=1 Tax=Marinivivus vitaminiproducens TaxID=3035935 RepID=UPI0027A65847|nr:GNAT family N-acetyltransferase [Geminicoccaceae bacterium SCSIO 64248]